MIFMALVTGVNSTSVAKIYSYLKYLKQNYFTLFITNISHWKHWNLK